MAETTAVLLHGAGLGAWVWADVVEALEGRAVALDVPAGPGVTPDRCAASLVDELDRRGVEDAMLIVHSLAGVLVPAFQARLGGRLRQCIYVAAAVPPAGGAYVDALGFGQRTLLRFLFAIRRKGLKPSASMIRRELCGDLPPERADEVVARYEPAFPDLYLTPAGPAPRLQGSAYVKLTLDRSLPPPQQDAMIARLQWPHVRMLETGHLPMLAAPEALAEIIREEVHAARAGHDEVRTLSPR